MVSAEGNAMLESVTPPVVSTSINMYPINPADRHKTAMVLSTSLGGTSFQWRVAPYGLSPNPAGYSRGMMFAMQNLSKVTLAPVSKGPRKGELSTVVVAPPGSMYAIRRQRRVRHVKTGSSFRATMRESLAPQVQIKRDRRGTARYCGLTDWGQRILQL